MGVEIGIYIQRYSSREGWKNIFLYQPNHEKIADIWFCGSEVADYIRTNGCMNVNLEEIEQLALLTNWIEPGEDTMPMPNFHVMTYSKVKYLANLYKYKECVDVTENTDQHSFWNELKNKIGNYIDFAGYGYEDSDNIRIIAFECC